MLHYRIHKRMFYVYLIVLITFLVIILRVFYLQVFKVNNIKINKIYDTTSQSFNGCRKRKIAIKKKRKSVIKFLSYL